MRRTVYFQKELEVLIFGVHAESLIMLAYFLEMAIIELAEIAASDRAGRSQTPSMADGATARGWAQAILAQPAAATDIAVGCSALSGRLQLACNPA